MKHHRLVVAFQLLVASAVFGCRESRCGAAARKPRTRRVARRWNGRRLRTLCADTSRSLRCA